ncbi:MAG: DNA polymerase III subunit epsilon [Betaproteobacteria bacterium]|nr:DNA polymerase III subunit epsilon [Betaproteobacteria bacterium]NBX88803.1 DNA polymerase III subunit epsilon [Betaproteobacteria bacterium]
MRLIVLDTETTGLSAENGDRIIEIGCVELLNRKITGNHFHHYLNPERDSHEDALKVHGISNEFLRDKPKFDAIAAAFLDFISGAQLIIHNAAFDVGFLNKELERANLGPLSGHISGITDTLSMAKEMYPGKRNSLDALCDRLGVDNASRTLHGALLDAELLADVYICLTRGQNALLIQEDAADPTQQVLTDIDLSQFELPVVFASEQEAQAHLVAMDHLSKASADQTVWNNHA